MIRPEPRLCRNANAFGKVLSGGFDEVGRAQVGRSCEQNFARFLIGKRGQNGHAIAEGFVKRAGLGQIDAPQIGADGIQQSVADFVGDDVRAGA